MVKLRDKEIEKQDFAGAEFISNWIRNLKSIHWSGGSMEFKSYAKINIGLRVVGKRDDGFHDIETFFQQINLHDTLDIETTATGEILITTSDPECPTDHSNLVYRAAEILRSKIGQAELGCRIHIDKKIPMGGGLGGGSSNAATALRALNQLWNCGIDPQGLRDIGLKLGSDVPFFIRGGFSLGEGRGEILTHIEECFDYYGLLICPNLHISTALVYNNLNLDLTIKDNFINFSGFIPRIKDTFLWKKYLENDLTSVVFKHHPEFRQVLEELYDLDAFYAHMSGSGSTLFGLFESTEQAEKAEHYFREKYRSIPFRPLF
jgi:4-diphosphocytidyl-2-C-methyl-D-erythritol kinase